MWILTSSGIFTDLATLFLQDLWETAFSGGTTMKDVPFGVSYCQGHSLVEIRRSWNKKYTI